jgi:hypothetical protein
VTGAVGAREAFARPPRRLAHDPPGTCPLVLRGPNSLYQEITDKIIAEFE